MHDDLIADSFDEDPRLDEPLEEAFADDTVDDPNPDDPDLWDRHSTDEAGDEDQDETEMQSARDDPRHQDSQEPAPASTAAQSPFQEGYMEEIRHVPIVDVDPGDAPAWRHQSDEVGCAIAAEQGILESLGVHSSEEELRSLAVTNGWHDPETGTYADDVGRLLEANGVAVERGYEHTLTDLYDALNQNAKVLVGLDANEIWNPVHGHGGAPLEQPDTSHVVWVTGMELDDAGGVRFILNDSGTPDGREMAVDSIDFLNAWADFGNFAVFARRT